MEPSTPDDLDLDLEHDPHSSLFLLRVWLRPEAPEGWRGRVLHTTTGETHTFRSCAELRRAVQCMMSSEPCASSMADPSP